MPNSENSSASALPLVYACSGGSSAAQMANWLAIQLDRIGAADMSCTAGIGGNVEAHIKKLKAAGATIVLDGCAKNCARACMETHGLGPTMHIELTDLGVPNLRHQDFDLEQARLVLDSLLPKIAEQMAKMPLAGNAAARP